MSEYQIWRPNFNHGNEHFTDDEVRDAVGFIKAQFLGWKSPPVQLPADSVIEMVAREILLRGWKRGYEDA